MKMMDGKKVAEALADAVPYVKGHLDLEGFAFVKLVRTGPDSCFAMDVTNMVLKGEEPAGGKMDQAEISRTFWRVPAAEKWDKMRPRGGRS